MHQIKTTITTFTDGSNVIRAVYQHVKILVINSKIVICKTIAVELLMFLGTIATGLVKVVKQIQ